MNDAVVINIAVHPTTTSLHRACRAGDLAEVQQLLQHGADVNGLNTRRETPLYIAALFNFIDIAQTLLANTADVSLKDTKGKTALDVATRRGSIEMVELLLHAGTDVNTKNSTKNSTPLHIAVHKNHIDIARILIQAGAHLDAVRPHGWAPLHLAAVEGRMEMVRLLVEKGARINAIYDVAKRVSPLHIAISIQNIEIAKLLLQLGANVHLPVKEGWMPIHLACADVEMMKLLIQFGADAGQRCELAGGMTPLQVASKHECVEVVNELLLRHHNVDVNEPLPHRSLLGRTPVWHAAHSGNLTLVNLLIQHGANTSVGDVHGWTPLHMAAERGNIDVVKVLLQQNNTKVDVINVAGKTPLYIAARAGHVDIVKMLIQHGANVHNAQANRYTPLHIASEEGNYDVVKELLQCGAVCDVIGGYYRHHTPLYLATMNGHNDVVKLLVQYGASLEEHDMHGCSPLHIAAKHRFPKLVEALIMLGADVNNNMVEHKQTALHIAAVHGGLKVVQELVRLGADVTLRNIYDQTPLAHVMQHRADNAVTNIFSHTRNNNGVGGGVGVIFGNVCAPVDLGSSTARETEVIKFLKGHTRSPLSLELLSYNCIRKYIDCFSTEQIMRLPETFSSCLVICYFQKMRARAKNKKE